MHRYLLRLGFINLYSYGAMLALAFIFATFLAARQARRQGIGTNTILDLGLLIVISGLSGARILFVLLNADYYFSRPLDMLKVWEGGLVFYGGFLLALAVFILYIRRNKLDLWKLADIFAAPAALGIAIGRIGCFLNGCCYGRVSFCCGVAFPARDNPPAFEQQVFDGIIPANASCSLPVLPTQLYESGACLLIFLVLVHLGRRKRFPGFLFWMLVLFYAAARFVIEGLRFYEPNFVLGFLTVSQLISAALFITALFALAAGTRKT